MTIETATYITDLNAAYPGATDLKSEGDDHIRLLKAVVKATVPNFGGAVTTTHTALNYLTTAVTADVTGKVGIGTVAPGVVLDVLMSQAAATNVRVNNPSSANGAVALFTAQSDASDIRLGAFSSLTPSIGSTSWVYTSTATPLVLGTAGAERMRITSAGQVGIGKTPTQALDVNGTVLATAFSGPLTGNVTGNATGSSGSTTGNAATATTAATVTTAAQPAITSVGTLASLVVTGLTSIGVNGTNSTNGYNFSGPSYGGAMEMRTNGVTTDRGWRLGMRDSGTGFTPEVYYLDSNPNVVSFRSGINAGGGIVAASFSGPLFGNVTGNVTGNATGSSGSTTGNAATATTAAACSGNAATATTAAACSGNAASASNVLAGATDGTNELGYKGLPSASVTSGAFAASDKGKCVYATAGVTVPNTTMALGDVVTIINTTASPITITATVTTLRQAGTTNAGNRTLAAYGMASVVFASSALAFINGAGLT